jgi:hypothetical protein
MEVDREDGLRRPPPRQAYRPGAATLRVPESALMATLGLLTRSGQRESGVLWYGQRDSTGSGVVAHVAAPRQRMARLNYHVSPEALGELVHHLPPHWRPLAQVHSHPGIDVEHSLYDDRMVSSRRLLSLVFPMYGRVSAPFPAGVGVHEWQDDYWHLLSVADAARRVVIISGEVTVEDRR